jgi:hypothetical protein
MHEQIIQCKDKQLCNLSIYPIQCKDRQLCKLPTYLSICLSTLFSVKTDIYVYLSIYLPTYPIQCKDRQLRKLSLYLSMALQSFCWTFAAFSVSWSFTQSVGLLGRGISQSQGRYLNTGQQKHRLHTGIHASSEIRTHDPSAWPGEGSSCLRPRDHCDRRLCNNFDFY